MRHIRDERARPVCDLYANLQDIKLADKCVRRLIPIIEAKITDEVAISALWNTAVMSYCRAFNGGCRKLIPTKVIEDLGPNSLGLHERIKDIRDKHIAHPVNSFEEVAYLLCLDKFQHFIEGDRLVRICSVADGISMMEEWVLLMEQLQNWLSRGIKEELKVIREWVDTIHPADYNGLPVFFFDGDELNKDPSEKRAKKPNLEMLHRLMKERLEGESEW